MAFALPLDLAHAISWLRREPLPALKCSSGCSAKGDVTPDPVFSPGNASRKALSGSSCLKGLLFWMHSVSENILAPSRYWYMKVNWRAHFFEGRCFSHLYPNEKNAGAYGDPARKQLDDSISDRKNMSLFCAVKIELTKSQQFSG